MHIVTVFNAAVCLSHTECCHPFTTKITINLHQLLLLNQEKVVKECKICSWAVPVGGFVLSSSFGNFPKVFGTNWSLFLTPMWVQPHHYNLGDFSPLVQSGTPPHGYNATTALLTPMWVQGHQQNFGQHDHNWQPIVLPNATFAFSLVHFIIGRICRYTQLIWERCHA